MKQHRLRIAPSLISADFTNLQRDIRLVEKGKADWLHLDIMDGQFVPNITFGPLIVRAVRKMTKLPLDAHMMIRHPENFLADFAAAGVDRLTVHVETCPHLHRTIQRIRELGMKPGVTLNPATPIGAVKEILPFVDLLLIMTVNPGFGGQQFISSMISKVKSAAEMISAVNPEALLEIDGGVDETNAPDLREAGATVFVAGTSIFSKKSIPLAIQSLRAASRRSA